MSRRVYLLVAAVLAALLVSSPSAAAEKHKKDDRRHEEIRRLERQINEHQRRLDALRHEEAGLHRQVEQAERNLPKARDSLRRAEDQFRALQKEIDAARQTLDAARSNLRNATQNLTDTTTRVEEGQPSSTPFGKARAEYLEARSAYQAAVDRIENSPEYKAAYQQAVASASRTTLLPEVRKKWIDEDPAVTRARSTLAQAKTAYEGLRSELLRNSPLWKTASAALEQARSQEDTSEKHLQTLSGRLAGLKKSAARLHADVNGMESGLSRARSALRQIPSVRESLHRQIEHDRRELNRLR